MFPTTPVVNQTYNGYRWNGELWEVYLEPEVGSIVQKIESKNSTRVNFSQTQKSFSTFIQASITPKYDNSIIIVQASMSLDAGTGNYSCIETRILKNSTELIQRILLLYTANNTFHRVAMIPELFHDDSGILAGQSYTYEIQGANSSGSTYTGTYTGAANTHNTSQLILFEVKQ